MVTIVVFYFASSLPNCSFTGIMPAHLNQCINLVELNLSNNLLHALPRCLHLPKLKRLNISKNPFLVRFAKENGPPLIEQFPRLTSLELDPELKEVSDSYAASVCSFISLGQELLQCFIPF